MSSVRQIGISTVVFHNKMQNTKVYTDIYPALRSLREIGYRFIQINTRSLPNPFLIKEGNMMKVAKLAASLGLHVPSIHVGYNPGVIGSPHKELREEAIEWIERTIDLCQVFKSSYVGIHPGRGSVKGYMIDSVQRLAEFSQEAGMKLLLETGGEFVIIPGTLRETIASIQNKNIGMLVDIGHCARAEENPGQAIRTAGEYLFGLHIHDYSPGERDHLIPGEGIIDFKKIIRVLEDIGYEGVFMLECMYSKTTEDKYLIARRAKEISERLLADFQN